MSAPELVAGYVVGGKYAIRSRLLHGGSMATYRAVAPKNREVALKLYDPAILSYADVVKSLALHQSIGAKLPPQQIVPIAESGTDANSGAPFTVTDFQSGSSLAQLIDRGPLSASAMLALVGNLARATDLLHSNGITSLSLHPGNVFVGPGAQHEVRIADFGASLVRSALPASEKAGRWMPWLAPEQIKKQVPAAQAADIFALGLLAFFAVTGKPYWRSCQVKAPDLAALRREILGERMPASVRAGEFSITLNPAVDVVFARALAFRPADRYATARDFAAGLDAALSARSVAEVDAAPAPSPGDAASAAGRMAPPAPRKMLNRSTMLGMGSPPPKQPMGPSTMAAGPRPPLSTIMGMGESVAEAQTAALTKGTSPGVAPAPANPSAPARGAPPAKPFAPAMATAPVKTSAPAMTAPTARAASRATAAPTAMLAPPVRAVAPAMSPALAMPAPTAVSAAPAMPVAPAMYAEPPMVLSPRTTATQRRGPPPLPMAPPPAQLEQVLATFEAGPSDRLPETASPASSTTGADVVEPHSAWPTAEHGDSGAESMQTGVAVIGAIFRDIPKNSRFRWGASIGGLLVLMGGAAWALSGRSTSGSRDRAASDAKVSATAPARAAKALPTSAAPGAMVPPQGAEETRTGASLGPAALPPPAPAGQQPEAAEPAAPAAENNAAVTGGSAPSSTLTRTAPGAPRPSQKPCGKFLKRCK